MSHLIAGRSDAAEKSNSVWGSVDSRVGYVKVKQLNPVYSLLVENPFQSYGLSILVSPQTRSEPSCFFSLHKSKPCQNFSLYSENLNVVNSRIPIVTSLHGPSGVVKVEEVATSSKPPLSSLQF